MQMETKFKRLIATSLQVLGISIFILMAAASASNKSSSSSSSSDIYRRAVAGGAVGAISGLEGYVWIGYASSESEAKQMARDKGYKYYRYHPASSSVYAK